MLQNFKHSVTYYIVKHSITLRKTTLKVNCVCGGEGGIQSNTRQISFSDKLQEQI